MQNFIGGLVLGLILGAAGFFGLIVLFSEPIEPVTIVVTATPDTSNASASTPIENQPTSQPAVSPPVQATIAYQDVCGANENDMTDPQIAAYAEQYIGQRVSGWRGYVYDVVSRSDGTYNLEIAMQERGLFWSRDLVVENIVSDLALRLSVEQPVTLSGRIARNEVFLESVCNPLVVDDYILVEHH